MVWKLQGKPDYSPIFSLPDVNSLSLSYVSLVYLGVEESVSLVVTITTAEFWIWPFYLKVVERLWYSGGGRADVLF